MKKLICREVRAENLGRGGLQGSSLKRRSVSGAQEESRLGVSPRGASTRMEVKQERVTTTKATRAMSGGKGNRGGKD